GRWDEAAVELEAALERALELDHGTAPLLDVFCRLARIDVHRDDLAAAEGWLARADAALERDHVPAGHVAQSAIARATLLDATGESDAARDLLADAYTGTPPGVRQVIAMMAGVPLVRLTVATGHGHELAEDLLADLPDEPTDPTVPWLRGILDDDAGTVREALVCARTHGTWLHGELPLLLEDAAEVLGRADGGSDEAAELLTEALDLWEDMGAVREVARLEARLRDLGVRRGKRGRRQRPATGWEALTETEQRVVDLVAEGLIYREVGERMFISRRTVETHVAHIFTKLDISNRGDLLTAYEARQARAT
ncbi:MAG: LuxR C-terminal-related transcriptional regulator, partial [Actinobacteria bacterium]|nr:LuxR C-terminal-related transcriptional regulator [Actinomycetota bacterium]